MDQAGHKARPNPTHRGVNWFTPPVHADRDGKMMNSEVWFFKCDEWRTCLYRWIEEVEVIIPVVVSSEMVTWVRRTEPLKLAGWWCLRRVALFFFNRKNGWAAGALWMDSGDEETTLGGWNWWPEFWAEREREKESSGLYIFLRERREKWKMATKWKSERGQTWRRKNAVIRVRFSFFSLSFSLLCFPAFSSFFLRKITLCSAFLSLYFSRPKNILPFHSFFKPPFIAEKLRHLKQQIRGELGDKWGRKSRLIVVCFC